LKLQFITYLKNTFEIDRDVFWLLINKTWLAIKGPISIYFILRYLTADDQGLWYTFLSLGALSTFAELGFTSIITQFISHEFAFLAEKKGLLTGSQTKLDKIISLIRFSIKFYSAIIPIAILILILVGYYYFDENWKKIYFTWTIFSIVGGITLFSSLFQAIYQGLDKVKETQINILLGSIIMSLFNWILLYLNCSIWALVLGNALGLVVMSFLLYFTAPQLWKQIFIHKLSSKHKWGSKIIDLQWKYALSWASGVFIFSLYVPIINKLDGAVLAGKFGITYTVLSAIQGVAFSWLTAKIPKLNVFVALNNSKMAHETFTKSKLIGFLILIILSVLFCLSIFLLQDLMIFKNRFLSLSQTILLVIYFIESYIIGSGAILIRAYKQEPYYNFSIATAIFIFVNTILCVSFFSLTIALLVQVIVTAIFFIPWSNNIYTKFKNNG
jgi:O-antigen/teichoic acid export membrane protein